jgi:hypothetical protein
MKTKERKHKAWNVSIDTGLDRYSGVNYAPEKSDFVKENKEAIKAATAGRKAATHK